MRRAANIFVILTAVAAVVFVMRSRPSIEAEARDVMIADVRNDLTRLYDRASYYGALDHEAQEETGTLWPVAVMPEWFGEDLPTNQLLPGVQERRSNTQAAPRPWIDVAPPGDKAAHPPDPVAVRPEQAQFWYNPNVGVFRARVSAQIGQDEAIALYNHLNGVELAALNYSTDPARTPLAYTPGTAPSATLASREPQASVDVVPNDIKPVDAAPVEVEDTPAAYGLFTSDPIPPQVEPIDESVPVRARGRSRLKDRSR